ncbi:MAG: hypothetical protein Q9M50_11465 [Methylococcales bacterium]|nr:hypothetical protein [Methylococcales bacterium]
MNKVELINKLQAFIKMGNDKGYIYKDLTFDEAYPGVEPTSFIVNIVAKKSWKYSTTGKALDELIDVLWETTKSEIRKNIFTLSLYTIDEMVNSKKKKDREEIAANPDLTPEQIDKLCFDPEKSVSDRVIIAHRKINELTKKELYRIFDTNDDINIDLLTKRLSKDEDFKNLALKDDYLKLKVLQYTI